MANRDATDKQYSYEKMRKTVNAHVYFGSSGAVTLDGPASKGVLGVTKVSTPSQNGTYTFKFGVSVNGLSYVDTYIKTLVVDSVPEIEYSGSSSAAATALPAIWRDDINNNVPSFGDLAPSGVGQTASSGGSFTAGAYKWIVTAVDANGNETQLSTAVANEVSNGSVTTNQQVTISWTALPGAASYNVYRTPASGGSGSENVFVGNTTGISLADTGTAGSATYNVGTMGAKLPNSGLSAYNFARPPYGYGAVTLAFYVSTTLTNPAAGEGMRIQFEFGDSGAA